MRIKEFIFDTGLKKLFDKGKELEGKIKNNDPVLENIILDVRSYKEYFCYPGQYKIRLIISFIAIVYMFFFSGLAAALPALLIQNPSNEIKAIFFISILVVAGFITLSQVVFTLKGYYYGSVIQYYLNYFVFLFSLLVICIGKLTNISFAYFFFMALCCIVIKKILNSHYYTDFILSSMHYRIALILENRELNKLKGFNRKQLREYSRMMKSEKRKKIRSDKRERQSMDK
ncbi:hypothetical protein [Xenorhabdus littoralis]|uniref:hypothetical protein n=1 Tax=Xenorhabdus littoralis TaxID=2582835 RepID=UPI0029E7F7C8|nr:hypothetical protein [Xenorhabdus sp. psl]MDX7993178.1 hypothetical protein [Xenorhabdus sp. psl]